MQTPLPDQLTELKYGIRYGWLEDQRIAVIKTEGDMSRGAIDTWAEASLKLAQTWESPTPIAVLQDLSHPEQGFTPYARQRTMEILNTLPTDKTIFTAVLLPDNIINRIIDAFVRTVPFRYTQKHQIRVFTKFAEAEAWLRESALKA